jgi:hypothetical protein
MDKMSTGVGLGIALSLILAFFITMAMMLGILVGKDMVINDCKHYGSYKDGDTIEMTCKIKVDHQLDLTYN